MTKEAQGEKSNPPIIDPDSVELARTFYDGEGSRWWQRLITLIFIPLMHFSLAFVALGILLFSYWAFWPVSTFVPIKEPLEILNPNNVVYQGDYIVFRGGGVHYTDGVTVDVFAELQDGFVLQYPPSSYVTEKGSRRPLPAAKYAVPCFAPPGFYRLIITSVFHINPIRTETLVMRTEEFRIAPSADCRPGYGNRRSGLHKRTDFTSTRRMASNRPAARAN